VDFTVVDGGPSGSDFSQVGDQTGTYTVNADCTGTATIHFPNGQQLDLKLVVVKGGREVFGVVSALTAPDGTPLFVTTRSHGVRVDHDDLGSLASAMPAWHAPRERFQCSLWALPRTQKLTDQDETRHFSTRLPARLRKAHSAGAAATGLPDLSVILLTCNESCLLPTLSAHT
jgi:hypothetical protein